VVGEPNSGGFELRFASFLEQATDVQGFAKNYLAIGFKLDYVKSGGDLSNYTPDFFVRTPAIANFGSRKRKAAQNSTCRKKWRGLKIGVRTRPERKRMHSGMVLYLWITTGLRNTGRRNFRLWWRVSGSTRNEPPSEKDRPRSIPNHRVVH
jgi:hypothetical protein